MKTWHKWSLGVVVALVALLATLIGVVYASIDPSAYRGRIEALASEAVGRQVEIRGPITLSMLPWPSVELDDVSVADPTGIGDGPLAHADTVRATARPFALLTGRLAAGTLTIDGLRLKLVRTAAGRTNWQGVIDAIAAGPGQALGAAPVHNPHPPHRVTAGLPLSSMALGAIKLRGARISYDNAETDRQWTLYDATLDTGRMTDGKPFRLETSGRLTTRRVETVLHLHLVTRIEPHLADRFYRFSDLGLNVVAVGGRVPGGQQEANLGASGEIDFNSGRFGLDDVSFQSAGLAINGRVEGEGLNDRLAYYGRLTILPFSPRAVMQQLEIAAPHTQSPSALKHAGFDARFAGDAHAIRFRQIVARLDDSYLTGTARLEDFDDPHVRFALALNALDIDHYLPPGSAEQASGNTSGPTGQAAKDDTFDFALLHAIRFDGQLSIGALTAANLTLRRADVSLAARKGRLHMAALTAAAYGGRLDLAGDIMARSGMPRYALRGRMRHIALGGVMHDAVGSKRVTGTADVDLDLTAAGRRVSDLKRSLDGALALRLTNAQLHGYDLSADIARALGSTAASAASPKTDIRSLSARFVLHQGRAENDDLLLATPDLLAHGSGSYSVPKNRLAYRLLVNRSPAPGSGSASGSGTNSTPDAGAGSQTNASSGMRVPVVLDGTLLAPSPAIGQPQSIDTRSAPAPDNAAPAPADAKAG